MQLPTINRLLSEDFKGEESWIGKLLVPLNQLFQALVGGLNKGITFTENIACQLYTVNFNNNAAESSILFKSTLNTKPIGLLVVNVVDISNPPSALTGAVFPTWTYLSGSNQLNVSALSGLVANKQYQVTFLVF